MPTTDAPSSNKYDVVITMVMILITMLAFLLSIITIQTQKKHQNVISSFIPNLETQPSKYYYELFNWIYTPVWITTFGCIVIFQLYEDFTAWTYSIVLGGMALPLLLQPLIYPLGPDKDRPLFERYSFKANIWIAIFSFIGNYWYTHYFYSVLKAEYTMPSHRLNNVPIAMYFATHFYFSTYHALSNALLRKVITTYQRSLPRAFLFWSVIAILSYFTAFMETLTISSFPYYSFEDRDMAYKIGSAFYGIYFIFSFPMFFFFDDHIDDKNQLTGRYGMSMWETIVHACGCGMLVLCALDFIRLCFAKVPLIVGT